MTAAIVAWAWRTAMGSDPKDVCHRILQGELGPRLAAPGFAIPNVCPIPAPPAPSRSAKFLRRMGLHALECGKEAFRSAGLEPSPRVGVFLGYGGLRVHWNDMMEALSEQRDDGQGAWDRGLSRLHPFWMLQHLSNNVQALLATELGARGEGLTFGGANAGAQALAAAERALEAGTLDAALVVAHDTLLEPETLVDLGTWAQDILPGEAAVALVLRPCGAPKALARITALEGADGSPHLPQPELLQRLLARTPGPWDRVDLPAWTNLDTEIRKTLPETPATALQSALGQLGAAAAPAQAIFLAHALGGSGRGLGISAGSPGLLGAVAVEVP